VLSAHGEKAIADAVEYGNAILKFITPNDVGLTGSHQCGFYLPKAAWRMYSPQGPREGVNAEYSVRVTWPDGRITDSRVKWYGRRTRSEYRLTRFGRDFPWLVVDSVGDLLVLVMKSRQEFLAHVLDLEDDIQEIQSALGVEVVGSWALYVEGAERLETENECTERQLRQFAQSVAEFPRGEVFSEQAQAALRHCIRRFDDLSYDDLLVKCFNVEYRLFRMVERQICQSDVVRVFASVDDFLRTAARIMNRRKARAGRSLENHFEYLLNRAGIPYSMRPPVDGRPDVIIPGREQYEDPRYPVDTLFVVGIKTTCKDRWRQVLNEARRVPAKHLLTMQQGISLNQLREMHQANITLVVPQRLHRHYPPHSGIPIVTVGEFLETVSQRLGIL